MPKLLPRRHHGIQSGRRPRAPDPTVVPSSDPLIGCDSSCPGERKEFYEGLARLKELCPAGKYEKFAILICDLEHNLAHEYWSPLKHEIVRSCLTPSESSFMSMVLEDNPYCLWRDIDFMPFNGVSNPPFVDYILDQITTVEHEGEAMEAFAYVNLLRELQNSITHVHDDEVRDTLRLFHRRYGEAFGTPYRWVSVSCLGSLCLIWTADE
ncbi:hypothetical protein PoHVEF18_009253 [Penicillium ochrochloron]